jgi:hypothetical protein
MNEEHDLVFPLDVQNRMRTALVEDIDSRLKDLTALVALQETELALLWFVIIGYGCYLGGKAYHARQRNSRNSITA